MTQNSALSLAAAVTALVLGLLLAGVDTPISHAAKVYKWTEEDGSISYRDIPPPEEGGHIEEKIIDPNKNVIEPFRNPVINGSGKGKRTTQKAPVTTTPSSDNQGKLGLDAGLVEAGNLDPVEPSSGANPNPLQILPTPNVTPAPISAPPALTVPPVPTAPPPAALPTPTGPGS